MKILHFATSNKWKYEQAESYFEKHDIDLKQYVIEMPESRSEEGEQIAREKLESAYSKLGKPLFVLDGSFHIRALQNFPKSYVKFADKYIGADGIIKLLEGETDRYWGFLNVLGYKDGKDEKIFIGIQKGQVVQKLTHNKQGQIRDFDRVLVPEGYSKTFAEFSNNEIREYDNDVWRPCVFDEFISWYKKK